MPVPRPFLRNSFDGFELSTSTLGWWERRCCSVITIDGKDAPTNDKANTLDGRILYLHIPRIVPHDVTKEKEHIKNHHRHLFISLPPGIIP